MQCLENKNVCCYEGEVIDMLFLDILAFLWNKNNHNEEVEIENDNLAEKVKIEDLSLKIDCLSEKFENNNSKEIWRFVAEIGSFILLLLTAFGGTVMYLNTQFNNINERIDNCLTQEDIKPLESSVSEIELWVKGDINDSAKPGANKRIEKIEDILSIYPIRVNNPTVTNNLINTTSMENQSSNIKNTLTSEMYLGENPNGDKINIGDIVGQKVLLTYIEDNKEVYFWGELNSQYNWDGYCVTNTYKNDGTLYGICESNFDNGNRLNYESFYTSDTEEVWIHTKRTCTKKGNQGISEKYSYKYNDVKNFTFTNVRIYDFLYVKDFADLDDKIMLTYYNGLTSDGKYNDSSDMAYEIIFNSDGTIGTLYIGRFADGYFNDDTGKAKEIVFDSSNNINKYFYYNGTFSQGKRDREVSSKDYVTLDQINEILTGKKFDIELNWYISDDSI